MQLYQKMNAYVWEQDTKDNIGVQEGREWKCMNSYKEVKAMT